MRRNSFIQMSKLTNVKGRIGYISSHARQENLYAVYETVEKEFWTELAECNQEEFAKSGTDGKCIEARELIIALPESFVDYEPDKLLKLFTEHFKQNYEVECKAALHHNKRKTNYHIHLIFAERRRMEEPVEKIATRNMFYDENGKHVRTKKEILDEGGNLRKKCRIVPKGEVYERKLFAKKDVRFKQEGFLDEVKRSYTDLINIYVKDEKDKLQVFDKTGVYLPMKKVGKNNPKAEQIEENNKVRTQWNQTVDRALVSGVPEEQIMEVKGTEISRKATASIQRRGSNPALFQSMIMAAIYALELLIRMVSGRKKKDEEEHVTAEQASEGKEVQVPETAMRPTLVTEYSLMTLIYQKLNKINKTIYRKENELSAAEQALAGTKGVFKSKARKELQEKMEQLKSDIDGLKPLLQMTVEQHGYKTVKAFMTQYKATKAEYEGYTNEARKTAHSEGENPEIESVREKLKRKQEKVKKQEKRDKKKSLQKNNMFL